MSKNFSADDEPGVDMLAQVEQLMRVAAEELVTAVNSVKRGKLEDAKAATTAVRDLRAAYFLLMDETTIPLLLQNPKALVAYDAEVV